MLIYERNVHSGLSSLGAGKIAFPYFYNSAFCSLTQKTQLFIFDQRQKNKLYLKCLLEHNGQTDGPNRLYILY